MRIRALTGPIVLVALFATTPQLAVGQEDDEPSVEITCRACPGTDIEADRLGEFLAKNVTVKLSEKASETLGRVEVCRELISREEGVIGKSEGEPRFGCFPMDIAPAPEHWDEALAPGFGDRRKIKVGRLVVINHEEQYVPRECEGATHALRITLAAEDERAVPKYPWYLCLRVES